MRDITTVRTYKTPASTYIGYGIFVMGLGGLILLPIFLGISSHDGETVACCLITGFPIFVFWWLSRFQLTIGPDFVSYSSAFGKEQTVHLPDIPNGKVELVYENRRLFLAIISNGTIKMRIHHKIFSSKAYQDLSKTVQGNR